jgi:hypothetical protein
MQRIGFVTLVGSAHAAADAALMLASLRRFGGELQDSPLWVIHAGSSRPGDHDFADANIHQIRIEVQAAPHGIPFTGKVSACAHAEQLLSGEFDSLVWINPRALILQPPLAFQLDRAYRAALRPVHIRNIGAPIDGKPDGFWSAIYRHLEIEPPEQSVESYVDARRIRPYFNTHLFAVDPSLGLLQSWREHFEALSADGAFLARHCADDLHRIFLHQALFSALLTRCLAWERIRLLAPDYSYPLHLHHEIPPARQAANLDSLTCPVYEQPFEYPLTLNGLPAAEPLARWLESAGKPSA